jgi:hypothetical protein
MTDRELLEAAARAAGMDIIRSRLDDPMQRDMLVRKSPRNVHHDFGAWNPLTDDGDNRRLQVKLRFALIPCEGGGWDVVRYVGEGGAECVLASDMDANMAVVRAAAAMAKDAP